MVFDIVAVVAVVGSACVSIIHGIQSSKCNWIKCGCIECTRSLKKEEKENNNDEENSEVYLASPVIEGRTSII